MIASRRRFRLWAGALVLSLAFLAFSCGGSSDYAGGGTGGTGISTGSITAFGSVVVNGVHFRTDGDVAPGFKTKKVVNGADRSGRTAMEAFSVGLVVAVRHGAADNDASEIDYRSNVAGPVAEIISGADNVVVILGQTVVVDNAALFSALKRNDVVDVSGFSDDAGRIVVTSVLPAALPANVFQISGYVSGLAAQNAVFRLGPLPGGVGATVSVSYAGAAIVGLPAGTGLDNGMFVQVATTDREAVGGSIAASRIEKVASRTEFPDGAEVDLEGLITTPWSGQGSDRSFAVEGKLVRWGDGTTFGGGTADDLRSASRRVQIEGTETGGAVAAARIVFQ
jgi:hypothetical protein